MSRHRLDLKVKFKLGQAHALRQAKHTKGGSSFSMHDDTVEGEYTVVVKVSKDEAGVCSQSAPPSHNPAHQPTHQLAGAAASRMQAFGDDEFEYGKEHGAAGLFLSTLQHRSIATELEVPVIKISFFFVRA